MKRLLIHAGLPKCGSTSLQFVLASYRAMLAERGIFYPDASAYAPQDELREDRSSLSHMGLVNALVGASSGREDNASRPLLEITVREFEESGLETLLLSSESFCMRAGRISPNLVQKLIGGYHVELVIFTRRADFWTISFYKEFVKNLKRRYAGTLPSFLAGEGGAGWVQEFSLSRSVEQLTGVFRPSRIHILPLDLGAGDSVGLFGQVLGVPLEGLKGDPAILVGRNLELHKHGLPINHSPSDAAILFLGACNRIHAARDGFREMSVSSVIVGREIKEKVPLRLLSSLHSARILRRAQQDYARLPEFVEMPVTSYAPVEDDPKLPSRQRLKWEEWHLVAECIRPLLGEAGNQELSAAASRFSTRAGYQNIMAV
ncbi:hypothetical protein [Roseomonas populi]|uniref:Sulfotransferase domain-containing protein n=1 Tax=Roseomonas populi TaxID=3121582 RepID=A0ABT1WZM8_9PROT|nr:hypothetical protein [Roseomonas pecuniae]MCR0981284.1 hypothetical protein [Roseomonas pecuniae]